MNIQEALVKYNYAEITNQQLAEYFNFTENEAKLLDLFWEPAFNGSWIYLSPEMIKDNMGYKQVSHFYKDVLYKQYTENIDYMAITKEDPLVEFYEKNREIPNEEIFLLKKKIHTGGKPKKYYKITGKTFKKMLMKCGTKKGDEICEYYLKIEQLAIFMKEYTNELSKHLLQKQLEEKNRLLKESEEKESRMNAVHIELLSFKKLIEKNESIYLVATHQYALQGIFKAGRTQRNMKLRSSGHNNTHVKGDKVKVLREFKVNDSVAMENYIHKKLKGLLVSGEKEFFMCPYNLLENIIEMIINNDDEHNKLVNTIIDAVHALKCENFNSDIWTNGIDMNIFRDEMKLVVVGDDGKDETKATFDMSKATDEQKKKFVEECVKAYKNIIGDEQLCWKGFQKYLFPLLNIPRYKFKAKIWKEHFNEVKC